MSGCTTTRIPGAEAYQKSTYYSQHQPLPAQQLMPVEPLLRQKSGSLLNMPLLQHGLRMLRNRHRMWISKYISRQKAPMSMPRTKYRFQRCCFQLYCKNGILPGMQAAQIWRRDDEIPSRLLPMTSKRGTLKPMSGPATYQGQGCCSQCIIVNRVYVQKYSIFSVEIIYFFDFRLVVIFNSRMTNYRGQENVS